TMAESPYDPARMAQLEEELARINEEISKNIWLKRYENYKTYHTLKKELEALTKEIKKYSRYKRHKKRIQELKEKEITLKNQLELLDEYQKSPFHELLKPAEVAEPPTVKNPFDIVGALSYIKQLTTLKEYYRTKLEDLKKALTLLQERRRILEEIASLHPDEKIKEELRNLKKEIFDFEENLAIAKETLAVYERKIDENILKVTEEIKRQSERTAMIAAIIVALLVFSFLVKWLIRRYIQDNQRAYMANKFVNFNLAIFIILILLFSYIENVNYIVTILGFASAGIAIAMKDMFMSLLGWMVIVLGGSIHVGDRIKVTKEGQEFVGDVIDISLLRITILEDVTLTSYLKNIRSGRVIFIPNNYIFTDLIANYTHQGLKTVWDSLAFNITFDSNHKKAAHIAKEVARKYAKGYTDIARKQLNKLRSIYHLKNTNVDVRVYTFSEEWGIRVSVWYQTNSYATLTLRSTISTEIIERYLAEPDIHITYPAQKIYLTKEQKRDMVPPDQEEVG
ncbi:MAG: mechanosensitive ion channel, partial [Epsilonproteobacteria bacterium]|nr:mechanosensitive ion channel [Campylobacterota bacterium]